MLLVLSACGSPEKSTTLAFAYVETEEYCSPFGDTGLETCIVSLDIKNVTDVPQRISGTIYGYADGKVYKASTWLTNSIDVYEDTLNPGEKKGSVLAFDIPNGGKLTKVFVGPTSDPKDAILYVERISGTEWNLSELKMTTDVDNLVSRLSKSTGYSWESEFRSGVGDFHEIHIIEMVTNELAPFICYALVYPAPELTLSDLETYEDLESGVGLEIWGAEKRCVQIFDSTPGIKKVK